MKLIGTVLIACLAAGAAGAWIGGRVKSPGQIAAATGPPPPSTVTVTIDERVLVERLRVVGHVRSGKQASVSVLAPESVAIVTREVVQIGDRIDAGSLLGEIAGRPVFVVEGATPIYRTISPGDTGSDVEQLQRNLIDIGMLNGVTGVFDVGTRAAVRKLYESHGYDPLLANADLASANDSYLLAQTAVSDSKKALKSAGEVSALAVTVADAELRSARTDLLAAKTNAALNIEEAQARAVVERADLADLEGVLAEQVRAAGIDVLKADNEVVRVEAAGASMVEAATGRVRIAEQAVADARTAPDTTAATAALASARDALKRERASLAQVVASSGVIVPGSELVRVPELPAMLISSTFMLGTILSGPPWQVSSGDPIIDTYISTAQRTLISPGDEATFTFESQEFQGTVSLIEAALTTSPAGIEGHRVEIFTQLPVPSAALGAQTTVTITAEVSAGEVLAAPVGAVSLNSDGHPKVTELVGETQFVHLVVLGPSAGGYVEVQTLDAESGLRPGAVILVEDS